MAIAYDGSAVTATSTSPVTRTVSGSAGDLYIFGLAVGGGGSNISLPAVTSLGATWTIVASTTKTNQYVAVGWAYASGALSTESVAFTWVGGGQGALIIQPWSGARDLTGLTAGTDYATGTDNSAGNTTDKTVTFTTKANNSGIMAMVANWSGGGTWSADTSCENRATNNTTTGSCLASRNDFPLSIASLTTGATYSVNDNMLAAAMEVLVATGGAVRPVKMAGEWGGYAGTGGGFAG